MSVENGHNIFFTNIKTKKKIRLIAAKLLRYYLDSKISGWN